MDQMKLKEVSKAKHRILKKYFPAWARILGSRYTTLAYIDCFAGPGAYSGGEPGSPLVIIETAKELVQRNKFTIHAIFIERNRESADSLKRSVPTNLPSQLKVHIFNEDAHEFVPQLLKALPDVPSFFFVDPYGHPLTIPVINKILQRPHTEILLNLMWYVLNMHLNNPCVRDNIDRMFGHSDWESQDFMRLSALKRESSFLEYYLSYIDARYKLRFRIRFSPEDKIRGGENRTKYYLIHLSNHIKAVLLMKEVMWFLGDEEGTFDYSATTQQPLFSRTPTVHELIKYLTENYRGNRIAFDELREETWDLPFIEKHYREALRKLEQENRVRVRRIDSKKTGIRGRDIIMFL